jgi:hypothetical protein
MGVITYTAVDRGELVAGHSAATEYTIEIDFSIFKPNSKRNIDESVSLSGIRHTEFHHKESMMTVSTKLIKDESTRDELAEFFSSIDAGETFTIDPFGSFAASSKLYTATLSGDTDHAPHEKTEQARYSFEFNYTPSETVKS